MGVIGPFEQQESLVPISGASKWGPGYDPEAGYPKSPILGNPSLFGIE